MFLEMMMAGLLMYGLGTGFGADRLNRKKNTKPIDRRPDNIDRQWALYDNRGTDKFIELLGHDLWIDDSIGSWSKDYLFRKQMNWTAVCEIADKEGWKPWLTAPDHVDLRINGYYAMKYKNRMEYLKSQGCEKYCI